MFLVFLGPGANRISGDTSQFLNNSTKHRFIWISGQKGNDESNPKLCNGRCEHRIDRYGEKHYTCVRQWGFWGLYGPWSHQLSHSFSNNLTTI